MVITMLIMTVIAVIVAIVIIVIVIIVLVLVIILTIILIVILMRLGPRPRGARGARKRTNECRSGLILYNWSNAWYVSFVNSW